jgi:hypothetical protein
MIQKFSIILKKSKSWGFTVVLRVIYADADIQFGNGPIIITTSNGFMLTGQKMFSSISTVFNFYQLGFFAIEFSMLYDPFCHANNALILQLGKISPFPLLSILESIGKHEPAQGAGDWWRYCRRCNCSLPGCKGNPCQLV